jgi:hypothetical protein
MERGGPTARETLGC